MMRISLLHTLLNRFDFVLSYLVYYPCKRKEITALTTAQIISKYGVEHFYDNQGTHYIAFPKTISKNDALRTANKYFKVNSRRLIAHEARRIGNTIHFDKTLGKPVWAIEVSN